ncbi:SDR family NAD(P)-dependent oxidoreductase, partial [Streptomyces sp. NPDC020965]|uniref:SDR family NAD(P)-dependent oxidoreductase n=1 Tax=Streptomyces sp. NPDC020965 TaxID=3365105 RepID=UPI00378ADD16
RTVRFQDTVQALLESGHTTYLEVSPHPTLLPALEDTAERWADDRPTRSGGVTVTGTLRRGEGATAVLSAAGHLYTAGRELDWHALHSRIGGHSVDLPTYPFERRRYWRSTARAGDATALGLGRVDHPMLSAVMELPDDGALVLTGRLTHEHHAWAADHSLDGTAIFPAVAIIELFSEASGHTGLPLLEEVVFEQPLILPEQYQIQLRVRVFPAEQGHRAAWFFARGEGPEEGDGEWTRYASAVLAPESDRSPHPVLGVWPPEGGEMVPIESIRQRMDEFRYTFGPAFLGLRALWRVGNTVYSEATLPDSIGDREAGYRLHPALFDAALHGLLALDDNLRHGTVNLPFSWTNVRMTGADPRTVRARCTPVDTDSYQVTIYDESDAGVATGTLTTHPLPLHQLARLSGDGRLYRIGWRMADPAPTRPEPLTIALLGEGNTDLDDALRTSDHRIIRYAGLTELGAALDQQVAAPELVCLRCPDRAVLDADTVREAVLNALETARGWAADERLASSRLVLVTRGAAAVDPGDDIPDPTQAAVWGLIRSAQLEEPGRFCLLDLASDDVVAPETLLTALAVLAGGAEQLALRGGAVLRPQLRQTETAEALEIPAAAAWRLAPDRSGTLEGLALTPAPEALAELEPGQVRITVHAAGLNFRDLLVALGSDTVAIAESALGRDAAGVVLETGPGVTSLAPGDRVAGLAMPALATHVVADHRLVVRIPDDLPFPQAASLPAVWATAQYGLVELARLRPGESVLIHAAAGGLGTVAVHIAQLLGATVFATAHRRKWPALRALGLDDAHIADSRTTEFEERFRTATQGRGADVVLNSLAGPFTDASLRLLAPGGRFVETGVADLRDSADLALVRPDIAYLPFHLLEGDCTVERVSALLEDLADRWRSGSAPPLQVRCRDIRHAPEAFRSMRDARHIGKLVLTLPRTADPDGTVLITGGTGTVGRAVTRHLSAGGARHLLLLSRSGPQAPGIEELRAQVASEGAELTLFAGDAADPDTLTAALATIPAEHPLTAVVHVAGIIDDGLLASLTPQQVADVLRPKTDAALQLHRLTAQLELAEFTMFSSGAGVLGGPGQAHYAAANAFLDALAQHRRARGLPAQSLAWGLWGERSAMTDHLTSSDEARLHRFGVLPLTTDEGLALFGAARALPHPMLAPLRLGLGPLKSLAERGEPVPPLMSDLVRPTPSRRVGHAPAAEAGQLAARLTSLPAQERAAVLLETVQRYAAGVLGHDRADAIGVELTFKEVGFDSLTALELRNRISRAIGLRLSAGLLFDHPTPQQLTHHLVQKLWPQEPGDDAEPDVTDLTDVAEQVRRADPAELLALAPPETGT